MVLEMLFQLSIVTVVIYTVMMDFGHARSGYPFVSGLGSMLEATLAVSALWAFGFAVAESLNGRRT